MEKVDILLRRAGYGRVWWTARGAYHKARNILDRSPDVAGWVMITMTLDPARFPSGPQAGYEAACARFHAWNQSLKRMQGEDLNAPALRWARKMELHENGWPHWHMLVNLRKLKRDELKRLDEKWGLGYTNIEFIRDNNALQYALKYCMKVVSRSEQEDNHVLPACILDLDKKARWWRKHALYSPSQCAPRCFEETSAVI